MDLQLKSLFPKFNTLQIQFGDKDLKSIYGAGCIRSPKFFLIFMNPTGRNVSANSKWKGIRAPWIGTKNIWKLLYEAGLLSKDFFGKTQTLKPTEWTPKFTEELYSHLAKNKIYITNFAKCTQLDARPLKNGVFHAYRELLLKEIEMIRPKKIITFGNLVSSLLLEKPIKVSEYSGTKHENLNIENVQHLVYPTYYPVGQGLRNITKSIERMRCVQHSLR